MAQRRQKAVPSGPELFCTLVGAVGTDLEQVVTAVTHSFAAVRYSTKAFGTKETSIRLARLLHAISKYSELPLSPVDDYISSHMTAGDDFRAILGRDDAMAVLGLTQILKERQDADKAGRLSNRIQPRRAYVLRSLKTPAEVITLREIYGSSCYVIAAYAPHQFRRDYLAKRIAETRSEFPVDRQFARAEALIQRDQQEFDVKHGQNVRDTFHRADVFVDASEPESLQKSIDRFVQLIFGNSFHTPTKDEYAMFHAHTAAIRSAELGRQVGAAIATREGDIVAVGTNEVPKAFGGLYWCDDKPDRREFQEGEDSNERHKRNVIADTIKHMKNAGWFSDAKNSLDVNELTALALANNAPALPRVSQIRNLIEFGRAVHAEMAALTDAARRGVSVAGCTMYVTTFPCHMCARHVVSAGIARVIYIEPYARSLAAELYPDSIDVDTAEPGLHQVPFKPFVGVAPRQYLNLFTMTKRKTDDGKVLKFDPTSANLRYFQSPRVYLDNEDEQAALLKKLMKKKALI